jgi:hypothetical protein
MSLSLDLIDVVLAYYIPSNYVSGRPDQIRASRALPTSFLY